MVLGLQHVIADHAPDRGGTNGQSCGRFVDRHLTTLAAFAFAVRRDLLAMTQGADTRACPAIVVSLFSHLINRRLGILISLSVLSIPTALLAVAPDLSAFTALRIAQGLCMASAF